MPEIKTGATKARTETIHADHTRVDHKRKLSNKNQEVNEVVGTSAPPAGMSGVLRRMAFWYSESSLGQWFPLIFADRINIWEGFLHNFKRRKNPGIFRERGLKAQPGYNKKQLLAKTGVKVLVGAFVFAWLLTSAGRKKEKGKRKK